MFGEYALYYHGKVVALVCDDQLFIKPTIAGKAFINNYIEGIPYRGAKPYLLIPGDLLENSEWLTQLIRLTASELPEPKKTLKNSMCTHMHTPFCSLFIFQTKITYK